jgi:peptidyl-dipeptidase Dcp
LSIEELNSIKQTNGSYLIPLSNTTQQPDLSILENRAAREKLFKAAWIRAEKDDTNDTRETLIKLAKKRAEKAKLMGFDNYAEWSLQETMAKTPENAIQILKELSPYAVSTAKKRS